VSATSAAAEALDAMRLRGQKLGELAEKSTELNDEAHDFHDVASQLRKKMQQKSIFG
jgi:uncharacterized tellurite resistance protein B-like protein